jgi:hypothetical protein
MTGDQIEQRSEDGGEDGAGAPHSLRVEQVGENQGHCAVQGNYYTGKILGDGDVDEGTRVGLKIFETGFLILLVCGIVGYELYKYSKVGQLDWWDYVILLFLGALILWDASTYFLRRHALGGSPEVRVAPAEDGAPLQCTLELPLAPGKAPRINEATATLKVYDVRLTIKRDNDGSSYYTKEMDDLYSAKVVLSPSKVDSCLYHGEIDVATDLPRSKISELHFIVWQLDVHLDIARSPDWRTTVPLWAE